MDISCRTAPEPAMSGPSPHTSRLTLLLGLPGLWLHSPASQHQLWHTLGPGPRCLSIWPHSPGANSLHTRQGMATTRSRGQPCLPDHSQFSACHNRRAHTANTGGTPEAYSSGDQRGVHCWDLRRCLQRCLLRKAISPRLENITRLPST